MLDAFIKLKATGIRTMSPLNESFDGTASVTTFKAVDYDELHKRLKDNGAYDEMRKGVLALGNSQFSINDVWRLSKLAIKTLIDFRNEKIVPKTPRD